MMARIFRPWVILALIFLVGIATGSILTTTLRPHFIHPPGEQDMKKHWMTRLTQKLNLTDDEQAKIQPILSQAVSQMEALHHEEIERGAKIMAITDAQISALLTPDQKTELQKMESEREKEFSGHMHSWMGMHHHDGFESPGSPPPESPSPPATNQ